MPDLANESLPIDLSVLGRATRLTASTESNAWSSIRSHPSGTVYSATETASRTSVLPSFENTATPSVEKSSLPESNEMRVKVSQSRKSDAPNETTRLSLISEGMAISLADPS